VLALVAWATLGAVLFPLVPGSGVPFPAGVVEGGSVDVTVCAPVATCRSDTLGTRSGIHCIQRSSRKISGVSSVSETMFIRRDWRRMVGDFSPFQHI
jgi:hypothetical protein